MEPHKLILAKGKWPITWRLENQKKQFVYSLWSIIWPLWFQPRRVMLPVSIECDKSGKTRHVNTCFICIFIHISRDIILFLHLPEKRIRFKQTTKYGTCWQLWMIELNLIKLNFISKRWWGAKSQWYEVMHIYCPTDAFNFNPLQIITSNPPHSTGLIIGRHRTDPKRAISSYREKRQQ